MKVTKKSTKLILKVSIATLLALAMIVTGLGIYFSSSKKTPPTVVDPISWATDTWDGETKDETNWVDAYAGRDNRTYTITSASGFAYFISVVNNENLAKEYNYFKDYTVYLNNNIDLANKVVESIGKKITVQGETTSTFQGTFDGGFYTIFNARIDGNGLFGYAHNATIKNVGLYNATISSSSEYAGAILGEGVNTNIENCYARLGRVISQNAAGLVGKLTLENTISSETSMGSVVGSMPNTDVKISNSFADLELKGTTANYGLVANYVSNGNELEIDTCYYTNATETLGGDVEDVKETEVIANPKRNSFNNWSYTKEYSLDVIWCNYSHIAGSEKLDFNYPILSMFNKVFMTGSGYENTVTNSEGEVKNVVTIADAFELALEDTSKEVEVNILVEKIFMQETAVAEESTKVSLNTAVETTLVRGEANPEIMLVGTDYSKISLGDENATDNTPKLILDGERERVEKEGLETGALIYSQGNDFDMYDNVILQNNINTTGDGGALMLNLCFEIDDNDNIINEPVINGGLIQNCEAENGGGVQIVHSQVTFEDTVIQNNKATGNGGNVSITDEEYVYNEQTKTVLKGSLARAYKASYSSTDYMASVKVVTSLIHVGTFIGGTISGGSATSGGGIYFSMGSTTNTIYVYGNAIIKSNSATYGGGIYVSQGSSSKTCAVGFGYVTIQSNTASSQGGGMYVGDYSYITDYNASLNSSNSNVANITSNTATSGYGGGIYFTNYSTSKDQTIPIKVYSNKASYGAGIRIDGTTAKTLYDYSIYSNVPYSTSSNCYGGGIYQAAGTVTIATSTKIYSNNISTASSGYGGGLYRAGGTVKGLTTSTCYSNTADTGNNTYNCGYKSLTKVSSSTGGATIYYLDSTTFGTASKTGYAFYGWSTSASSTTRTYTSSSTFSYTGTGSISSNTNAGSTTVYAVWSRSVRITGYYVQPKSSDGPEVDLSSSTINGDKNGASYAAIERLETKTASKTTTSYCVYNGTIDSIAATVPAAVSRLGYVFVGWGTSSTSTSSSYSGGATWNMDVSKASTSVNLYAVWRRTATIRGYTTSSSAYVDKATTIYCAYNGVINTIAAATPAAQTRSGYNFAGWSTAADNVAEYSAGATHSVGMLNAASTVSVYAVWSRSVTVRGYTTSSSAYVDKVTTSYCAYTGSITSISAVTPAAQTRSGYNFAGWASAGNSTTVSYAAESSASVGISSVSASISVYAVWSRTLTLVGNYGSSATVTTSKTSTCAYTGTVTSITATTPAAQTRSGYDFAGWSTANDSTAEYAAGASRGAISVSTSVTSSNLYAVWSRSVEVCATIYNDSLVSQFSNTCAYTGSVTSIPVTLSTFTHERTGYTLAGWECQDFTWDEDGYSVGQTITLNWDGSSDSIMYYDITAVYSRTARLITHASDTTTTANTPLTSTKYVTASSQVNSININAPAALTKTGYTFASWNTKADGTGTSYAAGAAVSVTVTAATYAGTCASNGHNYTNTICLYAKWTPFTYSVAYNGNGSTSGSMSNSSHTYDVAKNLTAENFTRKYTVSFNSNGGDAVTAKEAEYTFASWNTKSDGTGTSYANKASVKNLTSTNGATVNLYAQWTAKSITLPTATRAGYTFNGWATSASGSAAYAAGATITPTSNATLYATWTGNTYTITTDLNGGSSVTNPTSYTTSGSNQTLTLTRPTQAGYTFTGWTITTQTSGSNSSISGNTLTIPANAYGNIAIQATKTANKYTVTFYANGGTTGTASKEVTFASTYGTLPTATRTGYTSKGWRQNMFYEDMAIHKADHYFNGSTGQFVSYAEYDSYKVDVKPSTAYTIINSGGSTAPGYGIYNASGTLLTYKNYANTVTVNFTTPNTASYIVFSVVTQSSSTRYDKTTFKLFETATSTSAALSSSTTVATPSNHILIHMWDVNSYSITYKDKGDVAFSGTHTSGYPTTFVYNVATSLKTATKSGYTFGGWFTNKDCTGTAITTLAANTYSSNVTLYAKWTAISYTISYNLNGGTVSTANPTSYTVETATFVLNAPTKTGYTFTGWTGTNGTTPQTAVTISKGSIGNKSYTANYIDNIKPVVTITRKDYNTFNWTASDGVGVTAYAITNSNVAPSSGWVTSGTLTSGSYDVSAEKTYYVWAKDAAGNINSASVAAHKITISKGTGTSLTVKAGTDAITAATNYVINGTSLTITASLNVGYNSLVLTYGGTSIASGTTKAVNASAAIVTSATTNKNTAYKVNHFVMNTSGQYESSPTKTENKTGETLAGLTLYNLKMDSLIVQYGILYDYGEVNGSAVTTTNILADGSLVINLYYKRLAYTVTLTKGIGISAVSGAGSYYYGASVTINATVVSGYTWNNWTKVENSTQLTTTKEYTFTMGVVSLHYQANAKDVTTPTVTITRKDYNTFNWSATDTIGVTAYAITTSSSTPTSWVTTGTLTNGAYDISAQGTYYVWAKDAANNTNKASISAYTVTRNQGTGTALTTLYESSTGTRFDSNTVVLSGTPIYVSATLNTGYNSLIIKKSGSIITSGSTHTITSNTTIETVSTINKYSIVFHSNFETDATVEQSNITYNTQTALRANTFTRTGYAFKGWATSSTGAVVYSDQAQIINLTTYNNGKVHLYACWQKESYTITFNTNGGTSVATGSYPYGSSLPTSEKTGYTFNGWTLQGSATVYTQTPDLGANGAQVTLYASWTVKQYQVTIEKSEHTSNADVWGSKEFNSPLEITWSANRAAGYTYSLVNVVIYEANNIGNQIAVYTTGNSATFTMSEVYYPSIHIVVTHVRTINTYSISYELNGGTVSPENPTEYTVESETFTLNNPEKEGYTFAGWTGTGLSSASFNVRITQGSTGNRSYVANFTANANTPYTVKHYLEKLNIASPNTSNSAHWDATDTEVLTGTTATNTSATANSYAGFTAMAFSQKSIAANGSTVISIYYTRNTYTLTLNKGTGISSVSNAGVYDYQQSVKIDAEVMVGYTWNSWTGSLNTTTKNYTLTIGTEDITLTANATINKYTITFVSDSYGYVSTDEVVNVPYGSTLSVNGNEITVNDTTVTANANTNCVFKGWTILSNPLTGEYVVEKSLTISAHFELSKVTVTLEAKGGSVNPASKLATISQSYGAAFGSLPIPYYEGFQFMGWYLESSFLTKVTESTIVTIAEDHNLYAKWGATVSLAQEGMETNNTYSYNILKESDGSNIVMEAGVTSSSYVVPLNYKIQVVANGTNSSTKQLVLLYVNDVYKATSTEFTGNESLAVYKVTNNISIKLVFKNAYEITLTDENNNKIDEDIVSLVTVDSTSSTVVNNSTFIAEDSVIKLTINTNNLPKHFIGFTYKTTDEESYKMSFESTNTNNIVKELKDNVYTYTISNLDINNITVVMRDEVNVVSASLSPQIQGLTLTETTTGLIRNIISSKSYPLYSGEWTVVCTSGYTLTVSDLELVANSLGVSTSLLRYVNNTWVLTVTANS